MFENLDLLLSFAVIFGVFITLALEKITPALVALAGMAIMMVGGIVSTDDMLNVFSSSAPLTIACMFIISAAISEAGLIDRLAKSIKNFAGEKKAVALIAILGLVFILSAFMNNTPTVIILAPIIMEIAKAFDSGQRRYLLPLSYVAIMGGMTTIIGTSTNILVDGIAQEEGLKSFHIFEITAPAMIMAVTGIIFLSLLGRYALPQTDKQIKPQRLAQLLRFERPVKRRQLNSRNAALTLLILFSVVILAALDVMPIAGLAFIGAVMVMLCGCVTPRQAFHSMDWGVLLLIYGMLGIGTGMNNSGAAELLVLHSVEVVKDFGPIFILAAVYFLTSFLTETVTNNAVAVIITPIVIGLTQSLGLEPRPYIVAVMLASSASFATPIGYQTNTYVYSKGNLTFTDFLKIGLPMNILMWLTAVLIIPFFWELEA